MICLTIRPGLLLFLGWLSEQPPRPLKAKGVVTFYISYPHQALHILRGSKPRQLIYCAGSSGDKSFSTHIGSWWHASFTFSHCCAKYLHVFSTHHCMLGLQLHRLCTTPFLQCWAIPWMQKYHGSVCKAWAFRPPMVGSCDSRHHSPILSFRETSHLYLRYQPQQHLASA